MKENTLHKILSVLVEDYGYQQVRKSLDRFSSQPTRVGETKKASDATRRESKAGPDAIAIVESMGIDDEQKRKILLKIARNFEKKSFMPNINSVRAFLARQGKDVSRIKSRQKSAAVVFKCLSDWEANNLYDLYMKGSYSGPKSLSVIAESIENWGGKAAQEETSS